MASVNVRNVLLSQTATLGSKKQEVVCNGTMVRRKRDPETHQVTETIDGYAVNVLSAKGEVQTVKLPIDTVDVIAKINEALSANMMVKVRFTKFFGRFWAMIDSNSGRINQGISASASDIEIVSIEDPEDEELFDEIEL